MAMAKARARKRTQFLRYSVLAVALAVARAL